MERLLAVLGTLAVELKRRRVPRVAMAYAVAGFLIVQVANNFFPALQLPPWATTLVVVFVLLGFPLALLLAWAFDITPAGVRRTEPLAPAPEPAPAGGRPRSASMVAGLLLGIAIVALVFALHTRLAQDEGAAPWEGAGPASNGAGVSPVRSIAVLPFVNMSPDPENEYFSDGLTEELLNGLAQVEGLRVAARTSAFAFKGRSEDAGEIGRALGVELLLEGSVRKFQNRIRVTAQLIDAQAGHHLWSATYDRELSDIFAIQEDISRAIVQTLLPRFAASVDIGPHSTTSIEAYELYLQGRFAFWRGPGEQNLREAADYYERAIAKDSAYALAYAGLADAYMLLAGAVPPAEVFPKAKAAALRALHLDEQLAEGHVALGSINWFYDWDWAAAERNYRRSFSVNRVLYTRCICYAWYLAVLGDMDAAVKEAERVQSLDPVSPLAMSTLAQIYYLAGKHDEARAQLERLRVTGSRSTVPARVAAWIEWDQGRRSEAVSLLEDAAADFGGASGFAATAPPALVAELAYMYAGLDRTEAAAALAQALARRAESAYVPPEYVAAAYGAAGRVPEASEWLDRAYANRSNLPMLSVQPVARALGAVPRWGELMRLIAVPGRSGPAA